MCGPLVFSILERDLLERSDILQKDVICPFQVYDPPCEGPDLAPQSIHFFSKCSVSLGLLVVLLLLRFPLSGVEPVCHMLHYEAIEAPHHCGEAE